MTALELLRRALNDANAQFREGQLEAIEALLERRRVLVVQRTGWGKSMVYFLTTALLRRRGAGPTIIISPLLALMRNQIEAAERIGIQAATVNSSNTAEWSTVRSRLNRGEVDVLLISPERLGNQQFIDDFLLPIAESVGMLVIDEAHCISDWGHDFRPDYRRINHILQRLPSNIPVLGTTATANQRVVDDVLEQLGTGALEQRGDLVRPSLSLHVEQLPSQAARLAWLAEAIRRLSGSGIVYCLTTRDASRVAEWLSLCGIAAKAYFGDSPNRPELERELLDNKVRALVATSALGMGFDKPDLAFVIHFQCPQSIIHYYQQVGRAGRGIERAVGALLVGDEDRRIAEYFFRNAFPPKDVVDRILRALDQAPDGLKRKEIEQQVNERSSVIKHALKLLSVEAQPPVFKQGPRWYRTIHPFQLDERRIEFLTNRRRLELAEIERYVDSDGCLMRFLTVALDSPSGRECGRCSSCLGRPVIDARPSEELERNAATFLSRADVEFAPRRSWTTDALESAHGWRGNIDAELRVETGRALCRWGDMFWADQVSFGKQQGRFDDALVSGSAALISERWKLDPAPRWVTCVPSRRTGQLVPDFARRLAAKLGLPFVDCVKKVRDTEPQKTMENSFHQASNLAGAFEIDVLGARRQPVLLVDDIVDSGWTFTVVGAQLRESVGCVVYPFALAASTSA